MSAFPPSVLSAGDSLVRALLTHLHQLVDGVQQAVAVLPQQALVEPLVSEAHLQQHGHQGRVLSGSGVNASLKGRRRQEKKSWLSVWPLHRV